MGLNRPLIQMSRLFLADRIADNDVDSSLSKAILEVRRCCMVPIASPMLIIVPQLLARCETITTELLEEFKVPKVLSQYSKRGNETFKKLVKQIEEKAAANSKDLASKPKQERTGEEKEKDGKVKAPYSKAPSSVPPRTSNSDSVVGVKRPPSSEPAATQPAKRLASTNGGAVKPSPTLQKRLPSAVSDKATPAAGAVSAKPKSQTAAKVPNMYAGLQSAAKKSSVANTAVAKKAAAAPSDKKSPAPAAPTAAKPASSFSFSDYMRDLNKPKEPEKPKKDPKEDRPPETEEQKAKRLRKESRRHLRVSFKEGSALADVRLFQHEADEDTGRDANMVRDAGDVGDEGRMFKQHKDQMLLDGDEDEEMTDADAENLLEFHLPTRVDFTRIPADERQRNYAPYGGGEQQPVSQEKAVQEKHESDTLMEVYMDKSDIPSSPREPSDPFTGETASAKDFGAPPKQVLDRTALFRHQQHATATTQAQATPDISALLSAISAQTQQANQPQQQPAQAAPSGYENLQNIFAQYSAPTPPAPPPQAAAPQTSTTSDLSAILASLQAHGTTPQPPQAQAPQASPPAQMMLFPNMFPGTGQMPDLNAMMAMFSQGGMPPPPPGMSGFAPPMQQQGSSGGHYEDPERKAMREGGNDGSSSYNQNSSKPKPSYQPPKFVVPCRYYQQGACKKGARCTFRHD